METKRKARRLAPGDRVQLLVRCENLHLWVINGVVNEKGSIGCGAVTAPNAPDDPTCCKECGQPFSGVYTVTRDESEAAK